MLIEEIKDKTAYDAFAALRHLPMPVFISGWDGRNRRYTFVAASPLSTITTDGCVTEARDSLSGGVRTFKDPFEALDAVLNERRYDAAPPFPFSGGAIGFLTYDLKNIIEPAFARNAIKTTGVPESLIGVYDPIYVFDHNDERGYIVSTGADLRRFNEMQGLIKHRKTDKTPPLIKTAGPSTNMTKDAYLRMVGRAKEYIAAGDIYQINLSQRLSIPIKGDAFALFQRLQESHPGPFASFMDFNNFQIISNTPERLLRLTNGLLETEPIKGTRPRGKDLSHDILMIEELKSSLKERAEHVMIVDLERSDLGRVSVPGSVEVTAFEAIHTYEHLHHMVTTIRSRLKPGTSPAQALKACFPGGSVTGAPKFRAMEIIDELEPCSRGIYTGSIGWMDFNGNLDFSMAIRTAIIKDGMLHLHVGGGIVADSVPQEEYDETMLKAQDFLRSLD